MGRFELHHAIEEIWRFINEVNKYVNRKEPWKAENKAEIVYNLLEGIRIIATLITPLLPETAGKIFAQLGVPCGSLKDCTFGKIKEYAIRKGDILFKKSE